MRLKYEPASEPHATTLPTTDTPDRAVGRIESQLRQDWSHDVYKGARFPVEGERSVVSGWSLFQRLKCDKEEEEEDDFPAHL